MLWIYPRSHAAYRQQSETAGVEFCAAMQCVDPSDIVEGRSSEISVAAPSLADSFATRHWSHLPVHMSCAYAWDSCARCVWFTQISDL